MTAPLDAVPGGVLTMSSDMRILAANRELAEIVGRPPEELVGRSVDLLLSAPSRILFQTHVFPALKADGRVEEVFLTLATADGEATPALFNAVRSDDGTAYEGLIVRIRARSRWETDLLAATRELERQRAESQRLADELAATAKELEARYAEEQRLRTFRETFIGVLSHELRSPITTIFGMSHVLRERHRALDPESLAAHIEDIAVESDRLRRLTEDLLVLSLAEGGRLVVAAEPVAIRHVVAAVVEREGARATGHRFSFDASPDVPVILGEGLYIEQVVRNFLGNAAKYSPVGTTIHTSIVPEDGGAAVRVVDEGPGLPESPERLFEAFHRSPDVVGRVGGAGIGLFVCRELVAAMAGRTWAVPATRGAEFGFWLPAMNEGPTEG